MRITAALARQNGSLLAMAICFGTISQKTSTTNVRMPVAAAIYVLPINSMVIVATSADAPRLDRLFPNNNVANKIS